MDMKFTKRPSTLPTPITKAEGNMKKQDLDQYRSPSMWEKLEKWKAEKRKGQITKKAKRPFKAGSSSMQQNKGKIPSKASEKMKLLVESNLKTSWGYNTSPRHMNYRKSMPSARKVELSDKKVKRKGKENQRSVYRRSNRRETPLLSVDKVKTATGLKRDGGINTQELTKGESGNARRETLTLSTGKGKYRQEKEDVWSGDDNEEHDLRLELQVKRKKSIDGRSIDTLGGKQSRKKLKSAAARKDRGVPTERGPSLWMQSKLPPKSLGEQRDLRVGSDNRLHETSLASPSVHRRSSTSRGGQEQCMREKLEQWLLAKGKTPQRAASFMKTPKVVTRSRKNLEDSVLTVDEAMDACKNLLNEGCPAEYLYDWLMSIEAKLPCLSDMEPFLDCKKTIQESLEEQDSDAIIPSTSDISYPEASAEDKPEAASNPIPPVTPSRRKSRRSSFQLLSPLGELEESSAVKYQVRDATPYFKRIQQALGRTSDTPSTMIVTPVRRSIRLSKRKSVSFASRWGEDMCVSNLKEIDDLPLEKPVQLVLRSNRALEEEFDLNDGEM